MSDAPNRAWMFVDEDGDLLGYSRKPMHPEDYVEYIRAPDPELIERMRGWQLIMESDATWDDLAGMFRKDILAAHLRDLLDALEHPHD